MRESAVVTSLENIRSAQEIYRAVTGEFAANFDTLQHVIENDSIKIVTTFGNEDDKNSTEEFREVITYASALDSLKASTNFSLDSMRYIPFTNDEVFEIAADTLTYQSTLVNVVEVGTIWKKFMGKYADPNYAKYDNSYNPNARIKFGDMNAPNLAGNW